MTGLVINKNKNDVKSYVFKGDLLKFYILILLYK